MGEWIITRSGRRFFPLNPEAKDIKIADIAHALSHQCRFSGHTKEFYSVADHCLRVAAECSDETKLWALLHDAPEAYLVDLPRPVKESPSMQGYREAERNLIGVICKKFGLPIEMPEEVSVADWLLCCTEIKHLMYTGFLNPPNIIEGWATPLSYFGKVLTPEQAKENFIDTFNELF